MPTAHFSRAPHLKEHAVNSPSTPSRTRVFSPILMSLAFVAVISIAGTQTRAAAPSTLITAQASDRTPAPLLLADEITRRLRRMGISFSRTRLPHPYDPIGEVC